MITITIRRLIVVFRADLACDYAIDIGLLGFGK